MSHLHYHRAAIALVMFATGGGIPARAQPVTSSVETVTAPDPDNEYGQVEQVSTQGYDLASIDGQARMMQRIERAVRRVCRVDDRGSLAESAAYDACHDASRADAAAQLQVLIARAGGGEIQVASASPP